MIFNKDTLMEILKTNFQYKVLEDDIFGKVVELEARTAYRFCLTTNTYYPIDKYGLRLFGRFGTFNHRNYSLNPGLFSLDTKNNNFSDRNFPIKLGDSHPGLFEGNKRLLFVESHNTSKVIEETYNKIVKYDKKPTDYLINLVHKNGSQWEHYFEYIASEIFIRKGYLTDVQIPWSYHGRPDFGVYKHDILSLFRNMGFVKNGALILELSAIRIFQDVANPQIRVKDGEENKPGFNE